MLTTVKAAVEGERIEWQESVDAIMPANQRVDVLVTFLQDSQGNSSEERARRRTAALERLAARDPFASISNPEEWQREARQDRNFGEQR
jgi:hypothetical protein